MNKQVVLLVDDEPKILASLAEILNDRGFATRTARNASEAIAMAKEESIDLALLDLLLPDGDGIALMKRLKDARPGLPVIMLSGHGSVARAVEATKAGAFDFLEKPIESEKIVIAIDNALARARLEKDRDFFVEEARLRYPLVGDSPAMREIQRLIATVAPTESKVLITGESGTGKELVARALHLQSDRAAAPFLAVNCAAVPEELIESELFGHEKGAFTGAHQRAEGKFELASGGTLFLDEIGDMSQKLQAKILRAVEENEVQRVGGRGVIVVDVRLVAASNMDLKKAVRDRRFREDLYYRIGVITLHLPPLRERKEDIPQLVIHFLGLFAREQKRPVPVVPSSAMAVLFDYSWPGNVRELRNFVEKLVVFCAEREVSREEAAALISEGTLDGRMVRAKPMTLGEARRVAEREAILKCLLANGWDYDKAVCSLGVSRATLFSKIKELDIKRPR